MGSAAWIHPETVFLNRNENPLSPAPEAIEAIAKVARYGGRYHPFDEPAKLRSAIAGGIRSPTEILAGTVGLDTDKPSPAGCLLPLGFQSTCLAASK